MSSITDIAARAEVSVATVSRALRDLPGPRSSTVLSRCSSSKRGAALERTVVLARARSDGVLHIAATAASCDAGSEHAACHVHPAGVGVPVRIVEGGERRLTLVLSGRP